MHTVYTVRERNKLYSTGTVLEQERNILVEIIKLYVYIDKGTRNIEGTSNLLFLINYGNVHGTSKNIKD